MKKQPHIPTQTNTAARAARAAQRALAADIKRAVDETLHAVPRVVVRRLTGRVQGALESFERRHGVPIGGATVDLGVVLPRLMELADTDADPMAGGEGSPALERYRNAKADLAEMDIKVRSGELSDRAETRAGLMAIAAIFRNGGEAMEKAFGAVARIQFEQLIDDAVDEINRMFPGDTDAD